MAEEAAHYIVCECPAIKSIKLSLGNHSSYLKRSLKSHWACTKKSSECMAAVVFNTKDSYKQEYIGVLKNFPKCKKRFQEQYY